MQRGDVYLVRLNPVEGSEQAGTRPAIIVTRNSINFAAPIVMVTPFTNARNVKKAYPMQVLVKAPEGGLITDSVAMTHQTRVVSKRRLLRRLGVLTPASMAAIDRALRITLSL